MEIFDQQTNVLQANISSKYPVFTVSGLDSGKSLKISIYAVNVKGRSDSVLLEASTLKAAEKQTGKISSLLVICASTRSSGLQSLVELQ